jgi:hypothetical protein
MEVAILGFFMFDLRLRFSVRKRRVEIDVGNLG